jgi:hypothetical protein
MVLMRRFLVQKRRKRDNFEGLDESREAGKGVDEQRRPPFIGNLQQKL